MFVDKHLRQFIEVATHKNVSLAARQMGLSQPTLTHNMRKLEESLGTTLLVRHAGGVTLTAAGELLLAQARGQEFRNGFFDQTAQLWSQSGQMLATSHQIVYYKE